MGMEDYKGIATLIKEKGYLVAFTGAGISVDSGIPAFRGGQGCGKSMIPWNMLKYGLFIEIQKRYG